MAYTTKQSMITRFSERELIQRTDRAGTGAIDDDVLNQAINDGADEMDGYLFRYALPLSHPPKIFDKINADLARRNLYQDQTNEPVEASAKSAIEFMKMVGAGKILLGLDASGAAEVSKSSTIEFIAQDSGFSDAALDSF